MAQKVVLIKICLTLWLDYNSFVQISMRNFAKSDVLQTKVLLEFEIKSIF